MKAQEDIEPAPNILENTAPSAISYPTSRPSDVIDPWSTPPLPTPDEELAMPEEGFFPSITPAFLDPDNLKKERDYEEVLRKQVSPEFLAACPDFMEYMTTAATKSVYIVYEGSWTGINGFEPLELQFKEEMPERHG